MKDLLTALILGLVVLGGLLLSNLLGGLEGPIVFWLPIAAFVISFLSDTLWHRRKKKRKPLDT